MGQVRGGVGLEGKAGREGNVSAFHSISTGREWTPPPCVQVPPSILPPAPQLQLSGAHQEGPQLQFCPRQQPPVAAHPGPRSPAAGW